MACVPSFARQAVESRAVELHAVEMAFDRGLLERGEVDHPRVLVDGAHCLTQPEHAAARRAQRPLAFGDLADELSVEVVQVEVGPAVALGDPQEVPAVVQKVQIVVDVDPGGVGLAQQASRRAALPLGEEQVEGPLIARHRLDGELFSSGRPVDACHVLGRFGVEVDPDRRRRRVELDDADPDRWVGSSRLRIPLAHDARDGRLEVHELDLGDAGLVAVQKGDGPGIGRPPVADVAAAEDLLPVLPRQRAVEDGVRVAAGQPRLACPTRRRRRTGRARGRRRPSRRRGRDWRTSPRSRSRSAGRTGRRPSRARTRLLRGGRARGDRSDRTSPATASRSELSRPAASRVREAPWPRRSSDVAQACSDRAERRCADHPGAGPAGSLCRRHARRGAATRWRAAVRDRRSSRP